MKCEICSKDILKDSQCIDYKYYHNDCIINLTKENQELKKQLEEYKATNKILSHELTKDKVLQQDCLTTCCGIPIGDIPKLITQQKEFIDYMEEKIICYENYQNTNLGEYERNLYFDIYNDILEKYKETIGVSDEN